ncbi:MAG: chemotaxis protein CheB [Deltaproteobacteria bacterium]|nr:chemotaxis protein CheB [Deltaproteobacteria bacterium]
MGIRVLVIDDSAFSRQAIAGMLGGIPAVETVTTAVDGMDGYRQALRFAPDLIVLDLEMPNIDGLGFLRLFRGALKDIPVIVASGRRGRDDHAAAIGLGASDFIKKPTERASMEIFSITEELQNKIKATILPMKPRCRPARQGPISHSIGHPAAVVIGASTGGPRSVSRIVKSLPAGLASAVIVSIHMPRWLTAPFAQRLNSLSSVDVRVATDNEAVERGGVLIAPGGFQISFVRDGACVRIRLRKAGSKDSYAPSIDGMFSSASGVWGAGLAGVVLTGMGNDGSLGAIKIKENGGFLIAESRESSAVFSMPEAAISTGMVDLVLGAGDIGGWITSGCAPGSLKLA